MAERSRDRSSSTKSQPKFPECSYFRRRNDNHRRCQQCRLNDGLPLCTQDSPCLVCQDWLPEAWTAQAKATAQRNRRKAAAAAKAARKETQMMDDSVELHASRHAFPTKRPKSEESSKAKRSKTVASSSQPKSVASSVTAVERPSSHGSDHRRSRTPERKGRHGESPRHQLSRRDGHSSDRRESERARPSSSGGSSSRRRAESGRVSKASDARPSSSSSRHHQHHSTGDRRSLSSSSSRASLDRKSQPSHRERRRESSDRTGGTFVVRREFQLSPPKSKAPEKCTITVVASPARQIHIESAPAVPVPAPVADGSAGAGPAASGGSTTSDGPAVRNGTVTGNDQITARPQATAQPQGTARQQGTARPQGTALSQWTARPQLWIQTTQQMSRWWSHHTVHCYVLMTPTIPMVQHLFQQREWTDRQGRRIRQPRPWVVQTFPSWRGPALHLSSLPFRRPSIRQHWWILCRCGRCFNAAWNCLVFQTTPSVRLSRHLYLFLNVTQTTRDQPRRLNLQQEPSLQRGSSIRRRVLSVLSSDGPRRPTDRPGLPWELLERPWEDLGTTASPGIQDHAPHSPDPRQWSPQHEMSLHSTSMQRWTWIPREHFRRTRMLRATARRFLQHNMIPSSKLSLLPRERSRSTLPRLSEGPGPLCWTWLRQRFLTECPGWTSRLSRTPWRPRHG